MVAKHHGLRPEDVNEEAFIDPQTSRAIFNELGISDGSELVKVKMLIFIEEARGLGGRKK